MCSSVPNCSSGPCESAAKAISRCYSQSILCASLGFVRLDVCVSKRERKLVGVCVLCARPYLLLIGVRVPVAGFFFFFRFSFFFLELASLQA